MGHVDSGKSTLSGRLLHLLGRISRKDMRKNDEESKEKVCRFSLSYVLLYFFMCICISNCLCFNSFSRGRDHLLLHGPWMRAVKKGNEV